MFGQFPRRKRRAGQTVATRFGADVKNRIALALCRATGELFVTQYAEAKNIYQGITFETFVEINFAADRWNAHAISVMRDAGHDAGKKTTIRREVLAVAGDRPEVERVEAKFRARSHRENVANDSAYSGGRALEWLNRARMIVALDLERDGPAVANIDNASVFFAGFNQNIWADGWKFFQFFPGIFVRAMFAPHDRENSQLSEVRFATEDFFDPLELFRREAVLLDEFGCNNWIGGRRFMAHRHATLMNSQESLNDANRK